MEPPSKLRIVLDRNQVLQDALQKPEYWVYMAEPVFQEVEPKLRILSRGDVDQQVALWWTAYAPNIWTVRLKENAYWNDPRIQAMRDSDDVPTAQLYLFLYPEFLFSEDKHLGDFPISREMGQVSAAYRDIIDIRFGMQAASSVPIIGISATSELWKAFRCASWIISLKSSR
ncbi:MAG TPA: hypothetical protein VF043_03705 [Ktedonobacteraceae bacterium]